MTDTYNVYYPPVIAAWLRMSTAEDKLLDELQAAGLPEGWNDLWFDAYDISIEFGQCLPEYRLPQPVLDKLWAMKFRLCWINHTDGMQTLYSPEGETRYSDGTRRGKTWHKDEDARIATAQGEMACWSDERKSTVRLEGSAK